MPEVDANGNPIALLTPGRKIATVQSGTKGAATTWLRAEPSAYAGFRVTESAELRVFEDGQEVELG